MKRPAPPRTPAEAFGYHLGLRQDPRHQRNRPGNANGLLPQQVQRGTIYGDNVIPGVITGATITPFAQQQVMVMPNGRNRPGDPSLQVNPAMAAQLGETPLPTQAPMSGSQMLPPGDPQAMRRSGMSQGMDTSFSGQQRQRGRAGRA